MQMSRIASAGMRRPLAFDGNGRKGARCLHRRGLMRPSGWAEQRSLQSWGDSVRRRMVRRERWA